MFIYYYLQFWLNFSSSSDSISFVIFCWYVTNGPFFKKNKIVSLKVTTMSRLDNVNHYQYHMPTTKDHNSYSTLLLFLFTRISAEQTILHRSHHVFTILTLNWPVDMGANTETTIDASHFYLFIYFLVPLTGV